MCRLRSQRGLVVGGHLEKTTAADRSTRLEKMISDCERKTPSETNQKQKACGELLSDYFVVQRTL
jgi:hypothetical protein